MTTTVSIGPEVADPGAGIRLYCAASGLAQSRPVSGVAVLAGAGTEPFGPGLCLLERRPGSHADA